MSLESTDPEEGSSLAPTGRTRIGRKPERGSYDRETLHSILDRGIVCHLGFSVEDRPFVIPTTYARRGDSVLFHGAPAARLFRQMETGREICLSVTLIDALVLARSVFHHSLNYRSAVLFGVASEITGLDEKREALKVITDHLAPNRWEEARKPTEGEIRATSVFFLPIAEGSAKIRTGPPVDLEEDMGYPVWAGCIPLRTVLGPPEPDPTLYSGALLPSLLGHHRFDKNGFRQ
ncbi:MAG: pyridoxamine 5'-phosphate oxidase family protein [Sulfobacillus sp.]